MCLGLVSAQILKVRGVFSPSHSVADVGGEVIQIGPTGHRIAGRSYVVGPTRDGTPLVVVLHGDAPGRNPSYHYIFAANLAKTMPGTRVAALLRPGYADPFGGRSDGDRGNFAAGENYTFGAVSDLAVAIRALKARYGSRSLILVGHSGGATLAADVAALNPGLVQTVVLVSCPCDVPAFRRHMAKEQWSPVWLIPVKALSPLQTIRAMDSGTSIVGIFGSQDPIALPMYTKAYVQEAKTLHLNASMISLAGEGHEILLLPQVAEAVVSLVKNTHLE